MCKGDIHAMAPQFSLHANNRWDAIQSQFYLLHVAKTLALNILTRVRGSVTNN
jgi:hypothetical protein